MSRSGVYKIWPLFKEEVEVPVYYEHASVGKRRVDFFVENKVIVEIKAVAELTDAHLAQALNYLGFFFLAEDGIRDGTVTGVQTCALPIFGRVCAQDLMDESTGEILLEANEEITAEKVEILKKSGLETLEVFAIPHQDDADVVRNTLRKEDRKSVV